MGLIRLAIYAVVIYWAIRFFMQLKNPANGQSNSGTGPQQTNREDDYIDYEEVK